MSAPCVFVAMARSPYWQPTGASSGNAQVLQNGVMSDAIPFTVDALVLTSISPPSGGPLLNQFSCWTGTQEAKGGTCPGVRNRRWLMPHQTCGHSVGWL